MALDLTTWSTVDFIDSPEVLDCSVTPIPGSGSAPLQIVASLAAACYRIGIRDGIQSRLIGIYTGAVGHEVLVDHFGMGEGLFSDVFIPKGSRISLRAMGPVAITKNSLSIKFMGHPPGTFILL